jgi:hypothetical protein
MAPGSPNPGAIADASGNKSKGGPLSGAVFAVYRTFACSAARTSSSWAGWKICSVFFRP